MVHSAAQVKFDPLPLEHLNFRTVETMMRLDEGNGLLETSAKAKVNTIDSCLDNPKDGATLKIALALAMGNAADAVEIMCVGFILSEMGDISTFKKEFLSAAVFMGMLFGGIICGYVSDVIGRRPCLLYSLGLNLVAGLASAAAPNVDILIVCRVIGGLGIGGSVPIVFSMGAEIFPSDVRGKYLSVIASFWMVGAIFTAFSAWIMLGDDFSGGKIMPGVTWRAFAVVSALPVILAMLLAHTTIPESPRFLVSKKRFTEAAAVINKISALRIEAADLVLHELDGARTKIDIDNVESGENDHGHKSDYFPVGASSSHGSNSNVRRASSSDSTMSQKLKESTIALLFQGELFKTSAILIVIWFTLSFGSYGMSTWISTLFADVGIGNPYAASFIFALANLPGNVISLLYIETYGRRMLLSVGMCLAAASVLGFAFDTVDSVVVVTCAALFNAFSVVGWNSLDCLSGKTSVVFMNMLSFTTLLSLTVECFPTHVRTSAMGVLAAGGRLGSISAQFVNGSLEQNIPLLLFVTSACTVVGGLAAWLLPNDTVGTALSDADTVSDDRRNSSTVRSTKSGESIFSPLPGSHN